jgi:glucose-1-phosphate cytidylyltransferase
MKVVLLAGGLGTRLSEETEVRPKPMVEIGDRPILWHIMKHYMHYGLKEFYIALGYKGEIIKKFFLDYYALRGDITIDFANGESAVQGRDCEDWRVHLVDTGLHTMTGGRLRRLEGCVAGGTFMVTYGDGVCNVDIDELLRFHKSHGRIATVTAVRPPSRFGGLVLNEDGVVAEFTEKPQIGEGWINGGFLVFEPEVFRYIQSDQTVLESDTLETLAADGQLVAHRHEGFWQCMDTLRDKRLLEKLWVENRAPWRVWQ